MTRFRLLWAVIPAACLAAGCGGTPTRIGDGIPVRRLPEEVLGRPKAEASPVPLTMLRRADPGDYRLDRGDVLGLSVGELLEGDAGQLVRVPVRDDGTILLPDLPPVRVRGKSLAEVHQILVGMITGDIFLFGSKRLVLRGREKVTVELLERRKLRVLIVREDVSPTAGFGEPKKGTGHTVDLDPGRNDLLEALNRTGGPPGPDAKAEVVIRRGQFDPLDPARGFVRVPLRARPDEPLTFTEADITLNDGDTVSIEARDDEVYYTAGLIGSAQVPLPRDADVRVIEAITRVNGPLIEKGVVTVVRRLPGPRELRIRVDLDEAFRDPRENILVQPGDILVLQKKKCGTCCGPHWCRLPSLGCWISRPGACLSDCD
ncbi:MAG: polysaccharide biosynthesis/export family protein [Gemmataceae bacterium]|nr:polysaccharide biosynthesis/export family protein [Gemmataceae bacterium]